MLFFNLQKTNCTGCSACYSICPRQCIVMRQDSEGFYYPELKDNSCINCNLCEKVCPMIHSKSENSYRKTAVAAVANDYNIWHRSSSGGAFSEIVRHWADKDTLIVGAAWDGLKVHHVGVLGFENIAPLCKSKYVSSAVEDIFRDIRDHLKLGKRVIFCGCPCQVDGLRSFLRIEYDNLLTLDLICHGQGSPLVFAECLKVISKKLGEEVLTYEFRTKRKAYEQDYLTLVKTRRATYYLSEDPYIQLFLNQDALRPSCGENCKYRDVRRVGDITLADCKGLTNLYPDLLGTKRNWSTIVSNTAKGEAVLGLLKNTMQVRTCTIGDVVEYNPLFARQTWFSKDRDAFFDEFIMDSEKAIIQFTKPFYKYQGSSLRNLINMFPENMIKLLYRLFRKIR